MILTHKTTATDNNGIEIASCGRRRDMPGDGVFHRYSEEPVRTTCPQCLQLSDAVVHGLGVTHVTYGGLFNNDPRPQSPIIEPDFSVDENYNAKDE